MVTEGRNSPIEVKKLIVHGIGQEYKSPIHGVFNLDIAASMNVSKIEPIFMGKKIKNSPKKNTEKKMRTTQKSGSS